jgi:hypothetical protein
VVTVPLLAGGFGYDRGGYYPSAADIYSAAFASLLCAIDMKVFS